MQWGFYALLAGSCLLYKADPAAAATIHVPGDENTIQDAVNVASSGDVIQVAAGTYVEQVIVDGKDITIAGAGRANTFIHAPEILATTFTTPSINKPVVTAKNAFVVVIQDLTVDGLLNGNANNRFEGIAFWNAGGAVLSCDVVRISDNPPSGVQHGVGIYAFNDTSGPYSLEVGDCNVTQFQKNAMALSGAGLTVNVHDCTTIGAGDISYTAQNGIQVSYGASGTISDCTISDIRYTPATWVASGILVVEGSNVTTSGNNVISDVQAPVSWYDTNGTCGGCSIPSGGDFDAIFVYNSTSMAPGAIRPLPEPWMEAYSRPVGQQFVPFAVSVTGGCLTGPGGSGAGIYVLADGDPLTVDISNMKITGWDTGIVLDGDGVDASANDNSISGNATAGLDNTLSGNPVDAELNWWGAADGPSGTGPGSGNAVLGAAVDFSPWRTSSASDEPCAFVPSEINQAGPVDPLTCIYSDSACVAVDVDIARTDNTDMRGFSVDIELDNLVLCGVGIDEGNYLDDAGNTIFHVVDNGGGSYTVDCAILGAPCGQDAVSGTLFTINVSGVSEGTGTIEVTDVTFRDCLNAPIPGSAGDPLTLTIDLTAPVAVADLSASQITAGNDTDGTTEVAVSFTTPGDADAVEVYRAPFGVLPSGPNSYPEYDDEPGSGAPTAPTYPPGAPWQLTSLTASGNDETTERGYWYYVVFTADECGNMSLASNVSGGVLNYHLGDVSDGFTPGTGDNSVDTPDISLLGAHYGDPVPHNDAFNYLDVGPTADASPNSLPQTDNVLNFEDLIIFAINFGQVSATGGTPEELSWGAISEIPRVNLVMGPADARGNADLHVVLHGHDALVKGLHLVIDGIPGWTAAQVVAGDLIETQEMPVFFKAIPQERQLVIDIAALGNGKVLSGSGELASIRVPASTRARLAMADMRDAINRRIAAGSLTALPTRDASMTKMPLPTQVELLAARPNPFAETTGLAFRLPAESAVSVDVFDVNGRQVRSLVSQTYPAGEHLLSWDGRNDQGQSVGSGIYLVRMRAGADEQTQKVFRQR
jgi:hypothetical protein